MRAAKTVVKTVVMVQLLTIGVLGDGCPDDPETDLCGSRQMDGDQDVDSAQRMYGSVSPLLLMFGAVGRGGVAFLLPFLAAPLAVEAVLTDETRGTCGAFKALYKAENCCGNPTAKPQFDVVPKATKKKFNTTNICDGKKPQHSAAGAEDNYFDNIDCFKNGAREALEQAGANVTKGFQGTLDSGSRMPINTSYMDAGLCPVNVHWHLGTEHYSLGEYDEFGTGVGEEDPDGELDSRRLKAARRGWQCRLFDAAESKFTTEYNWQHCEGMHVGETYEVHWPHSAAGACGTPHQYQTPFYDGVFCRDGIISLSPLNTFEKIGVQAQVYTVVNDEDYYYPDLIRGWIVDGDYGSDIAYYTGSTTGTSRDNSICSRFTPITWQVDRKCHLISASSFDKMCADMKNQMDDMSTDLHPHGSRTLVWQNLTADNMARLRL